MKKCTKTSKGKSIVCLVCLKRFSCDESKLSNKLITKTNQDGLYEEDNQNESERNAEDPPSQEKKKDDKTRDIYRRFLVFSSRYFGLHVITARFRETAEQRDCETGEVLQAFCEDCLVLVQSICELYDELQLAQMKLSWKLELLGDLMDKANQSVSTKLAYGLVRDVTRNLNIPAIGQCDIFRKVIIAKCRAVKKLSQPKAIVPKGLFTEYCRFTYAATRKALMRLIMIFALASSISVTRTPAPPVSKKKKTGKPILRGKRRLSPTSRCRLKKKTTGSLTLQTASCVELALDVMKNSSAVKKLQATEEVKLEIEKCDRKERTNEEFDSFDYYSGLADNFSNDSDPSWSDADMGDGQDINSKSGGNSYSELGVVIKHGGVSCLRRSNRRRTLKNKLNIRESASGRSSSQSESEETEKEHDSDLVSKTNAAEDETGWVKCPECGKLIKNRSGLGSHLREIHNKPMEHPCDLCNKIFLHSRDYRHHRFTVHNCTKTGNVRTSRSKDRSTADVMCKICKKMCLGVIGLATHMRCVHGKKMQRNCEECGLKFTDLMKLRKHVLKAHPKPRRRSLNLKRKQSSCEICNMTFKNHKEYLTHFKRVHQKSEIDKKNFFVENMDQCHICFRRMTRPGMYKQHLAEEHKEGDVRGSGVFYCEVCSKTMYTRRGIKDHFAKYHDSKYVCFTCKEELPSGQELRAHLGSHETEEKTLYCNFCFKGFSNTQYFDIHRKIVHLSTFRRYFCDQNGCSREFENADGLKTHLLEHLQYLKSQPQQKQEETDKSQDAEETEEVEMKLDIGDFGASATVTVTDLIPKPDRIFSCKDCGNAFLTKNRLHLHELLHIPFKEEIGGYQCPQCSYVPKYVERLVYHFNRVHGENIRPYKCSPCARAFQDASEFQKHLKLHAKAAESGEEIDTQKKLCVDCGEECLDSVVIAWHNYKHRFDKRKKVSSEKDKSYSEDETDGEQQVKRRKKRVRCGDTVFRKKVKKAISVGKRAVGRPRKHGPENYPQGKILDGEDSPEGAVQCEVCQERYKSILFLRRHLQSKHEKIGEKTIQCCYCDLSFVHQQTYELHAKRRVFHNFKFVCDEQKCLAEFETHLELNEHLKSHVNDELVNENGESENNMKEEFKAIHYCPICNWGFLNPSFLQVHQITHTVPEKAGKYLCPGTECKATYYSPAPLMFHWNKVHGPNIKPHKCTLCGVSFHTRHQLRGHRYISHEIDPVKRRKFKRKFPSNEEEGVDPEKLYTCLICNNRKFATKSKFSQHKKRFHGGPFICQEEGCGKEFLLMGRYAYHRKTSHGQITQYMCQICGKFLGQKASLKYHIESVHKEPKFECKICHKMFRRNNALKDHMEQHNPDRLAFICPDCGKSFKSQSGMDYHIGSVHTANENRRHGCPYCPKRFNRPMLLKGHMRTCIKINGGNPDNLPINKGGWPKGKPRKKTDSEKNDEMEDKTTTEEESEAEDKPSTSNNKSIETRSIKRDKSIMKGEINSLSQLAPNTIPENGGVSMLNDLPSLFLNDPGNYQAWMNAAQGTQLHTDRI